MISEVVDAKIKKLLWPSWRIKLFWWHKYHKFPEWLELSEVSKYCLVPPKAITKAQKRRATKLVAELKKSGVL